jgi:hypothetical protein
VLCGGERNGQTAARASNPRRRTRRQVHFLFLRDTFSNSPC